MTAATPTPGVSFLRRRSTRVVIGAASVAGFTLLGATPAFAASAADCTDANTADAGAGDTYADIQALLDLDTAIICLSGTFDVDDTLLADYELTLFGLVDAVLDGGDDEQILAIESNDTLTVQNVTFANGFAESGDGGAINAYDVVAIDSVFAGNVAEFNGGAIAAYSVFSDGSTFTDNQSTFGGAIVTEALVETLDSTFTGNASMYGGAVFTYGTATITASTFEDNSAEFLAGAVLGDNGAVVTNSTFVGNSSGELGGAVLTEDGLILQSTFLDNTSSSGQSVVSWDGGGLDLRGNIFAGSTSEPHVAVEEATATDLGGNLFSTTESDETDLSDVQSSTGFGISTALFFDGATLADNGGPTETVALYAGSPAIDAVPAGEPSVDTDQRGVARDALSDAGAYEFVAALAPEKPALAATGSTSAGWAAGIAGVLLAAGAAVFAGARRRRA